MRSAYSIIKDCPYFQLSSVRQVKFILYRFVPFYTTVLTNTNRQHLPKTEKFRRFYAIITKQG